MPSTVRTSRALDPDPLGTKGASPVQPTAMEHTINRPKRPKPGYEPIYVSPTESWTSGRFIDHFLLTHRYAVSPANRELVRVVMRSYPGPRPIMAEDISTYLLRHFSRQHESG